MTVFLNRRLCFDSTGELLASVGGPFDNRLCVWHIPSQRLLATVSLASHESCAHSVMFLSSPFDVNCAGNVVPPLLLAVSGRSGLILWTLDGSLAAHVGEVEHDVMSLVPQVVARTTDAGMFDQSWLTLHTGCAGQWALAPNAAPTSMAYCSRAQLLVVGTQNGALMLFQMPPLPTTNVQFDESDAVMRQFSSGRLGVTELPVPRLWSATRVLPDAEVVTLHMSPLTSADSRDSVFYTIVIGSSESSSALHRVMLRVPAAVGASVALLPADDSRPVTAKQRAVVRSSVSTKEQQKAAQFKRRLDEETRLQKAALMGALAASPSGKRTPRAAPSQRGLSAWFVAEDWFAEGSTLRLDGAVVASQLDAAGEMGLVGTSVGTIWQVDLRRVSSAAQPSHVLAVGNSAAATRLLHAHSDSVHAVVFHPRVDDLLASAAADGSLRVWKRGAHQQIVHHQVCCFKFLFSVRSLELTTFGFAPFRSPTLCAHACNSSIVLRCRLKAPPHCIPRRILRWSAMSAPRCCVCCTLVAMPRRAPPRIQCAPRTPLWARWSRATRMVRCDCLTCSTSMLSPRRSCRRR
jgi:WD40 repeat protein